MRLPDIKNVRLVVTDIKTGISNEKPLAGTRIAESVLEEKIEDFFSNRAPCRLFFSAAAARLYDEVLDALAISGGEILVLNDTFRAWFGIGDGLYAAVSASRE